jgi:hypothetical protein
VGPACQREKESERARAAGPWLGFAGPHAGRPSAAGPG